MELEIDIVYVQDTKSYVRYIKSSIRYTKVYIRDAITKS